MGFTENLMALGMASGVAKELNSRYEPPERPASDIFVDAKTGSDSREGLTWGTAFLTMSTALAAVQSGGRIWVRGKVREQLTAPVGIFDVSIIGVANLPRHADDHSEPGGGASGSTWAPPAAPTAATPLLKVQQQGWRLVNMLIQPPTDAAAIQVFRDGGSGDDERDGSHFHLLGCRVAGGQDGVQFHGGPNFVRIEDCFFHQQTGNAIMNTVGAGIGTLLNTKILRCHFSDIAAAIVAPINKGFIVGNMIDEGLDLTGGTAPNIVTENVFMGDYSNTGGYVAVSGDLWFNNHAVDAAETEVDADGKTNAVPAA